MSELSQLYLELRVNLDSAEGLPSRIRSQLDPHTLDQLSAYSTSRDTSPSQSILNALDVFILAAADVAWREIQDHRSLRKRFDMEILNTIIDRYVRDSLAASTQKRLGGQITSPNPNQFRRMRG